MIDYNFNKLLSNNDPFVYNFFQNLCNLPTNDSNNIIDVLWNHIKELSENYFEEDISDIIDCLKTDVLFALYASVYYTNPEHKIQRKDIIDELKKYDSALENEDSVISKRQSLSHFKPNLSDRYCIFKTEMLKAGQLFNTNALLYFLPYWDKPEEPISCFNINDYVRFIQNRDLWPFDPSHQNGMSFFDYFKGIRNMSNYELSDKTISQEKTFDTEFFYYVFEQLFSPISFIDNLLLHQKYFSELFNDSKKPWRERSIVLLRPLFQMPHCLWEKFSDSYIQALQNYIKQQTDINLRELHTNMVFPICSMQYIFPFLKTIIGNFLFNAYKSDLTEMENCLYNYLNQHLELLHYQETFQNNMLSLAKATYPIKSSIPLDLVGNYQLAYYNYKLDKANKNKPVEPKGNDRKRNNKNILTYEANFTYHFFMQREISDYFSYLPHQDLPSYVNCIFFSYFDTPNHS